MHKHILHYFLTIYSLIAIKTAQLTLKSIIYNQ